MYNLIVLCYNLRSCHPGVVGLPRMQGLADNSIVSAGTPMPDEIIAVVRAKGMESFRQGGQQSPGNYSVSAGSKTIVPQSMVMNLEVKCFDFMPPEVNIPKATGGGKDEKAKVVYTGSTRASTKRRVKGLYRFNTKGNSLENLFNQIGTYVFHFSVVTLALLYITWSSG